MQTWSPSPTTPFGGIQQERSAAKESTSSQTKTLCVEAPSTSTISDLRLASVKWCSRTGTCSSTTTQQYKEEQSPTGAQHSRTSITPLCSSTTQLVSTLIPSLHLRQRPRFFTMIKSHRFSTSMLVGPRFLHKASVLST